MCYDSPESLIRFVTAKATATCCVNTLTEMDDRAHHTNRSDCLWHFGILATTLCADYIFNLAKGQYGKNLFAREWQSWQIKIKMKLTM